MARPSRASQADYAAEVSAHTQGHASKKGPVEPTSDSHPGGGRPPRDSRAGGPIPRCPAVATRMGQKSLFTYYTTSSSYIPACTAPNGRAPWLRAADRPFRGRSTYEGPSTSTGRAARRSTAKSEPPSRRTASPHHVFSADCERRSMPRLSALRRLFSKQAADGWSPEAEPVTRDVSRQRNARTASPDRRRVRP